MKARNTATHIILGWLLGLLVAVLFGFTPLVPAFILYVFPDIEHSIDTDTFDFAKIPYICVITLPMAAIFILIFTFGAIVRLKSVQRSNFSSEGESCSTDRR